MDRTGDRAWTDLWLVTGMETAKDDVGIFGRQWQRDPQRIKRDLGLSDPANKRRRQAMRADDIDANPAVQLKQTPDDSCNAATAGSCEQTWSITYSNMASRLIRRWWATGTVMALIK